MLTAVEVYSVRSDTPMLELDLTNAVATNPIQTRNIDGLNPVTAAITTSPYAAIDAERLTGASVGKRNIVFRFGLNADWDTWTVAELRQHLYRYFMPKVETRLRFRSTHLPTCEISGIVESVEPNIFAKDPEVLVSIICPDPDFVSLSETTLNGDVVDNPSTTDIEYEGSIPTGFVLQVHGTTSNPDYVGLLVLQIDTNFSDLALDPITVNAEQYLEISTISGNRYIRSVEIATGDISNALVAMMAGSAWPKLLPGLNEFRLGATELGQRWEMSYFARFGGL